MEREREFQTIKNIKKTSANRFLLSTECVPPQTYPHRDVRPYPTYFSASGKFLIDALKKYSPS